jgi:hypothetical protein
MNRKLGKKSHSDDRRFEWAKQRKEWGFDERETWCLFLYVAKFTLPRLKKYREISPGVPGCFSPSVTNEDWDAGRKKWHKILDDMIYAMEISSDDDKWYGPDVNHKRVQRGCKLFGEWFQTLWW